jgi:hypothetical protein
MTMDTRDKNARDQMIRIARKISERASFQGWKGKRGDAAALEAWAGALAGFMVARNDHSITDDPARDDAANYIAGIAALVVARAPLSETKRLAQMRTTYEPELPLEGGAQ